MDGSEYLMLGGKFVGLRKDVAIEELNLVKLELVSEPQLRILNGNKLLHTPTQLVLDAYDRNHIAVWRCLDSPKDKNQVWHTEADEQQQYQHQLQSATHSQRRSSVAKILLQAANNLYLKFQRQGPHLVPERAHASQFEFSHSADGFDILMLDGRFVGLRDDSVVDGTRMVKLELVSDPQLLRLNDKLLHIPSRRVLDAYGGNYITLWRRSEPPKDKNQIWRAHSVETTVASATAQHSSGWTGGESMALQSDSNHIVKLKANNTPGGLFQHPLFFGQGRLSKKQSKKQPVIVMTAADWKTVSDPHTTHAGAFGQDFAEWSKERVAERWVAGDYDPSHTSWVAVWKFPGDLNHLAGYKKIVDTPLPVGCYPLRDDDWWQPPVLHKDPQLPKGHAVEKLRCDLEAGGSIHHLENQDGIQVAMMGSHYFIKELWKATSAERSNVKQMLESLYRQGVYAFPCYDQHHAIVFYIDLADNQRITPAKLAEILKNVRRGNPILDILTSHARDQESIRPWASNYTRVYST